MKILAHSRPGAIDYIHVGYISASGRWEEEMPRPVVPQADQAEPKSATQSGVALTATAPKMNEPAETPSHFGFGYIVVILCLSLCLPLAFYGAARSARAARVRAPMRRSARRTARSHPLGT